MIRCMYYQGSPSAPVLAWGDVKVGQVYTGGPSYPSPGNAVFFTPGAQYTITAVLDASSPNYPMSLTQGKSVPLPWDENAGLANSVEARGYVQFGQALANGFAAGGWVRTECLANALRIS